MTDNRIDEEVIDRANRQDTKAYYFIKVTTRIPEKRKGCRNKGHTWSFTLSVKIMLFHQDVFGQLETERNESKATIGNPPS